MADDSSARKMDPSLVAEIMRSYVAQNRTVSIRSRI
jgi:hypothetical protein